MHRTIVVHSGNRKERESIENQETRMRAVLFARGNSDGLYAPSRLNERMSERQCPGASRSRHWATGKEDHIRYDKLHIAPVISLMLGTLRHL